MSHSASLIYLIALLLATTTTHSQTMQSLALNASAIADLLPHQTTTWTISLPQELDPQEDLFITVQSPPEDPLQQPSLSIKDKNQEIERCDTAKNEFAGICRVDYSKLKSGASLYITAKCPVSCHLTLTAALQPRLRLEPQKSLVLRSPIDSSAEYEFELEVPLSKDFSTLAVYAEIKDFSEVKGGLQLYANIGDENTEIPSGQSYDVTGQSLFWGGAGLYFSKTDFSPKKRWIKIYLILFADMEVKLSSVLDLGTMRSLTIGQTTFDYSAGQQKRYLLDLSGNKCEGKTVAIEFVAYGGTPSIKIAFDQDFSREISANPSGGMKTLVITEDILKDEQFAGAIYIGISSEGTSEFSLHPVMHNGKYLQISPGVGYYTELGSNDVFNYFFNDTIYVKQPSSYQDNQRKYTVSVENIEGEVRVGVRRCLNAEKGEGQESCLITRVDEVGDSELVPVTTYSQLKRRLILINYQISACSQLKTVVPETKVYHCSFHLFVSSNKVEKAKYTLTLTKRYYSSLLKEGELHQNTINKGEVLYYRFGLTSLKDIQKIVFFANILEGEVGLIASTTQPFPRFHSAEANSYSSIFNKIVLGRSELNNTVYLAVQGHQFSSYSIGVIVYRKQTETDSSPVHQQSAIQLQLGTTLSYSLKANERQALFQLLPSKDTNILIEVTELVGTLQLAVNLATSQENYCTKAETGSGTLLCEVSAKENEELLVVVGGELHSSQHFAISAYEKETCSSYSLNLPFYKQLEGGERGCLTFAVTKEAELVLSTSVSILHLLQNHLDLQLCIKGKCLKRTVSHQETIDKQMISVLCGFQTDNRQSCPITLTYSNLSPTSIQFTSILQESSLALALLDGISQRTVFGDPKKGEQFYYEVSSSSTISIFLTCLTHSSLSILAHFVEKSAFMADRSGSFLGYQAKDVLTDRKGTFIFTQKGSGSNLYAISSEEVERNCDDCILAISVFEDPNQPHSLPAFDIEVCQRETTLKIGEAKNGYLERNDVLLYQLEKPIEGDGVIEVRDLSTDSGHQTQCFQLSSKDYSHFSQGKTVIIDKLSSNLRLYITAVKPICSYQITYTHLETPVTSIIPQKHYPFQVTQDRTVYFTYTHQADSSFKTVALMSSGYVQISITPLSSSQLPNALTSPPAHQNDYGQAQLIVSSDSQVFCVRCTYLISVTTFNAARGEVAVELINSRVHLSPTSYLKQTIRPNQSYKKQYSFNSATDFNVSLNVLYGKVTVTVFDPTGRICAKQNVYGSVSIPVEHDHKSDQKYGFELNPIESEYRIDVESDTNSSYTIRTSTKGLGERIFEGVTSYLSLLQQRMSVLEFFNHDEGERDKQTLDALIEVVWKFNRGTPMPTINISVEVADQEGTKKPVDIISRQDSEHSINLQLPRLSGNYYLLISSDHEVYITILLVKQSLIHLKPESSLIMTKPATVELYSPQKQVMLEVFTCQGQLDLEGSAFYEHLASNSKSGKEVDLLLENYGGHYVVSSEKLSDQYYVRVNSKVPGQEVAYRLNYYYLNRPQQMPYKLVYLPSSAISYSVEAATITFRVESIMSHHIESSPIQDYSAEYRFYFSNDRSQVSKYSNCRLGSVVVKMGQQSNQGTVELSLGMDDIDGMYFAGAEAVVTLAVDSSQAEHYPRQVRILYDTLEIDKNSTSKEYSLETILTTIILPIMIIALIVYCLARWCIGKGMLFGNLVEEPNLESKTESQEGVNKEASSPTKNSGKGTADVLREDVIL